MFLAPLHRNQVFDVFSQWDKFEKFLISLVHLQGEKKQKTKYMFCQIRVGVRGEREREKMQRKEWEGKTYYNFF